MPASVESGVGISSIVNEGPVGPGFRLEDTVPLTLNKLEPLGEIIFNPQQTQSESSIPQVFLEAFETSENKARRIYEELQEQPDLTAGMLERAFLAAAKVGKSPRAFGWPRADLEYITIVLQGQSVEAEAKGLDKKVAGFHIPVLQENQNQKAFPQKAYNIFEQKAHKILHIQQEDHEVQKKRFVLDERAMEVVITEFRTAVRKASILAQRLGSNITGPLIKRFLPGQHPGNKSEAVKGRGFDGAIPERAEAIQKHGEFESEEEAERVSFEEVIRRPPVRIDKDGHGKRVTEEDVYRVFKNHEVKPKVEELEVERLTATREDVKVGPRINDYPDLAEVFEHKQAA